MLDLTVETLAIDFRRFFVMHSNAVSDVVVSLWWLARYGRSESVRSVG